ncbi:MAG: hypothetical protein KGO00_07040 [Bacteroidetes bacterium]|nr:hypothetical protein [Bacteroidota bacterium]
MLLGCQSFQKTPDVSAIDVPLTTIRFEQAFFAIDTLQLDPSLQKLAGQEHFFTQDFLYNILATTPQTAAKDVPQFMRAYQSMYKQVSTQFASLKTEEAAIKEGLQYVKYYFPDYKLPTKLITFIGPINSFGNIITIDALAVGLQMYLGKNDPIYLTEEGQNLYPVYVSRRFERAYMATNCMKNIIDDLYPLQDAGAPLCEQMVEAGKRLYFLKKVLPHEADSIVTGYTAAQLEGCYKSEKDIWSFFVQNNLLYEKDPSLIGDYMHDGPNTAVFGDSSPGFIGQFVGYRIVEAFLEKNKETSLDKLLKIPAKIIFEQAKYKP